VLSALFADGVGPPGRRSARTFWTPST